MELKPKKGKANTGKRHHGSYKRAFIRALENENSVIVACRKAGVTPATAYAERKKNATFAAAWDQAVEASTQRMERRAYALATVGEEDDLFMKDHNGKIVMVRRRRRVVPNLLMFLLKARRPDVYRERLSHEVTGADGGPVKTSVELCVPDAVLEAVAPKGAT